CFISKFSFRLSKANERQIKGRLSCSPTEKKTGQVLVNCTFVTSHSGNRFTTEAFLLIQSVKQAVALMNHWLWLMCGRYIVVNNFDDRQQRLRPIQEQPILLQRCVARRFRKRKDCKGTRQI